jgi:dTDP-4-dehydrorhamnose 3,5-epimerase
VKFEETPLPGAFVVVQERLEDERGYFARTFCQREFRSLGLPTEIVQTNTSFNERKGTLRGMHFQAGAAAESKLVRCTRGAIYDVIVDLRPDSPTYLKWYARELSERSGEMLFIPKGIAHGFQTLQAGCEVFYEMFDFFDPESARGVRWDDPAFGIIWPEEPNRIISRKDRSYPDFTK